MREAHFAFVCLALALFGNGLQGGVPAAAGEPASVRGRIESVTLYRAQALVTRVVPVTGAAGALEVVVSELPERVVADSLFAEGGEGVEVRAVRLRTRAVGAAPREEVRRLDEKIREVEDLQARNQSMQNLEAGRQAFLDKLEAFTAPAAMAELSKGVLNADALKSVALFSFEQRREAAEERLKLATEARDLAEQLGLLRRQRAQLTGGATRTVREAVLFIEKAGAGAGEIRLSYLTDGAGWTPAYNVRATAGGDDVELEYNATIRQMSGEDWSRAALTLSTATPAMAAQGPGLAPLPVALAAQPQVAQTASRDWSRQSKGYIQRRDEAAASQRLATSLGGNLQYNWTMNSALNAFDYACLTARPEDLSRFNNAVLVNGAEGPSVSYRLPGAVSLASRSDTQMVRIAQMSLPAQFYHVATPALTTYVYREAEIANTGDAAETLLAGAVSVYLEGRFVGRTEIPTVARGQLFVVGFGADGQLRATRELVEKEEAVQGGNRVMTFKYRLAIENYKDAAVKVRLLDRIPTTGRKQEIRITLDEMADNLSEDKLYLRAERPRGILRWDEVEVAPRAIGETARLVEFSYRVEFDRSMTLSSPGGSAAMANEQEFRQMQMGRMRH